MCGGDQMGYPGANIKNYHGYAQRMLSNPPSSRTSKPHGYAQDGRAQVHENPHAFVNLSQRAKQPGLSRKLLHGNGVRDEQNPNGGRSTVMFAHRSDSRKVPLINETAYAHGMAGAGRVGDTSYLTGHHQDKLYDGIPQASTMKGQPTNIQEYKRLAVAATDYAAVHRIRDTMGVQNTSSMPLRSGRGNSAY